MNFLTKLSTVSFSLLSRIFGLIGAIIIVSGATLFFAPAQVLAVTQYYGHIENVGGAIEVIPDTYPYNGGSAMYSCGSYSTQTQAYCAGSYTYGSASTATNGHTTIIPFEIGGASVSGTYYTNIFSAPGSGAYNSSTVIGYYEWTLSGGVFSTPTAPPSIPPDTSTRIISIVPVGGATIATSSTTTLSYTGYLNADDVNNGTFVYFNVKNSSCYSANCTGQSGLHIGILGNANAIYFENRQDLSKATTTDFSFSTSTAGLPVGKYFLTAKVYKGAMCVPSWLGGFCFNTVSEVYATSTTFIISEKTVTDLKVETYLGVKMGVSGLGSATSTDVFKANCSFSSFQLFNCLNDAFSVMFIPSSEELGLLGQELKTGVLTHYPLGLFTRFVDIISTTTPVAIPSLTYKFGSSSPTVLQSLTASDAISFNPFDVSYYGTSSPLLSIRSDQGDNKNIWDIINPFFTFLVTVGVMLVILDDLMGFELGGSSMATSSSLDTVDSNGRSTHEEVKNKEYALELSGSGSVFGQSRHIESKRSSVNYPSGRSYHKLSDSNRNRNKRKF